MQRPQVDLLLFASSKTGGGRERWRKGKTFL
jgi:hypothetical protein